MGTLVLVPLVLLVQAISFGIGIVIIVGAVKMMRLQSHGFATVASILAMLPCGPAWLLGLPMGIWSLVVLNRQNVKAAFDAQATRHPEQQPAEIESSARTHRLGWIATAIALLSLISLGLWFGPAILNRWSNKGLLEIGVRDAITGAKVLVSRGVEQAAVIDADTRPWAYLEPGVYQLVLMEGSRTGSSETRPGRIELSSSTVTVSAGTRHFVQLRFVEGESPDVAARVSAAMRQLFAPQWRAGPNGPVLTDDFARALSLGLGQIEEVNKVLPAIHEEYLALEAQNTERHINDAGHIVIRIKPFRGPIEKLENRLWSQLDAILDTKQQSVARNNFKLDPPDARIGISAAELVRPGFFGWGRNGATIEIWRVGAWYHWIVATRGYEYSSREPQLPEEYRRFWTEPDDATGPAERQEG